MRNRNRKERAMEALEDQQATQRRRASEAVGTWRNCRCPTMYLTRPWQSRVGPELWRLPWPCLMFVDARGTFESPSRYLIAFQCLPTYYHHRLVSANMAAVPGLDMSMLTFSARVATFASEHQLTKRRASSQKKKQPSTVSWPHESPSAEQVSPIRAISLILPLTYTHSLRAPASSSSPPLTATTMSNVSTAPLNSMDGRARMSPSKSTWPTRLNAPTPSVCPSRTSPPKNAIP